MGAAFDSLATFALTRVLGLATLLPQSSRTPFIKAVNRFFPPVRVPNDDPRLIQMDWLRDEWNLLKPRWSLLNHLGLTPEQYRRWMADKADRLPAGYVPPPLGRVTLADRG